MRTVFCLLLACVASAAAAQVEVTDVLGSRTAKGFAQATAPRTFSFPADHGAHPDYRSEWWYFTGNLETATGRHFGFQLTFFRVALAPSAAPRASAWATKQAWMAHFALTDTEAGQFHAAERLGRGALGIAGAETSPFRVWVDDWQAVSRAQGGLFPLRLKAANGKVTLELELSAVKSLTRQGQDGWDRKGSEPGNASYYYSYTRLVARGRLRTGGTQFEVTGTAWMDREWSTSALAPELAGWDWLSVQLSDGRDLMLYRLRRKDGGSDAFSKGALILPAGEKVPLSAEEFALEPRRWWTSAMTAVRYPVEWSLEIPSHGVSLQVEPRLEDQELDLSVRYWEGAVLTKGRVGAEKVTGVGYLELAGYSASDSAP